MPFPRGFTLIELIVVMAIIGIISSIVYASFGVSPERVRDKQRMSDLANFQVALRLYKDQYGEYPQIDEGMTIGTGGRIDTLLAPYMGGRVVPRDPLGGRRSGYEYYYDSEVMCSNIHTSHYYTAVFATAAETPSVSNWEYACGTPGSGSATGRGRGGGSGYGNDNASNQSYGIILH